ncbi:hypothetical protein [Nocardioides limicola]|uniref:hypothetical protein n=1 Tax=Nocardioides limicola TaxID=2803368 RepID=UPI00193AFA5A|nr:hypothetical protein [Nocardioides sp. DJM-14]
MTWLDALGWTGTAILVISLMQARVLRFRVLNLAGSVLLLAFNGLLQIWPMVALNALLAVINVWFTVKLLRTRHDTATYQVVQVRTDDGLLEHLLRLRAEDIAEHQPDFDVGALAERDYAFVVVAETQLVGVVLLDGDGDTAVVRLDYVLPAYRDFTPGEFVWRRSSMLAEHGFRRVLTSPQMVDDYYPHVGFRREGDRFVLDL